VANVPIAKLIHIKLVDWVTCTVNRPCRTGASPWASGAILRNAAFRRAIRWRAASRCSAQ